MNIPKYVKNKISGMKWPKIMVLHEKHETDYYYLEDEASLYKACLEILDARVKGGWIPDPGTTPYGLKEEVSQEQAELLPEPYKTQALKDRATNDRVRKYHEDDLRKWREAQEALAEKDGAGAFYVLDQRKDHEYERYDLETPRVPK